MDRPERRMARTAVLASAGVTSFLFAGLLAAATAWAAPPCGIWNFVPNPASPSGGSALYAVDALSSADVWAAGSSANASETFTLHWDGTAWSIMPSPNPGTFRPQNFITGLAAIAHDDVWGVGSYNADGGGGTGLPTVQTLALHWSGSKWNVVPSPAILGGSSFSAVSALAANDVWAVGQQNYSPNPAMKPLAAHWNGSAWAVTDAPFVGNRFNQLLGVSARAPGDVWAVGTWRNTSSTFHVLIQHWNGSAWSAVPAADPGNNDELLAVAALSANNVWAVGDRHDPASDTQQPLIMHWNGSAWSTTPLTGFHGDFARLNAIRAVSSTDIWAAGAFATVSGDPTSPLLMHWDGTSWTRVTAGTSGGSSEYFDALAISGDCAAWAVGSYLSNGAMAPFTERLQTVAQLAVPDDSPGAAKPGVLLALEAAPNPAAGVARIAMVLARSTRLRTAIFDPRGRRVRMLDERVASAGTVSLAWDGRDDAGAAAMPGIYFIHVSAGSEASTVRLVLRR